MAFLGNETLKVIPVATTGGSANAYTLTPSPAVTSYEGKLFNVIFHALNTSTSTLNISGLGTKTIKYNSGDDVRQNAINTDNVYQLIYDGTDLIMVNTPTPETLHFRPVGTLVAVTGATRFRGVALTNGSTLHFESRQFPESWKGGTITSARVGFKSAGTTTGTFDFEFSWAQVGQNINVSTASSLAHATGSNPSGTHGWTDFTSFANSSGLDYLDLLAIEFTNDSNVDLHIFGIEFNLV